MCKRQSLRLAIQRDILRPVGHDVSGTVDFVSPQIYWPTTHDTAPYIPLAKWWYSTANMYGSHLYTSVTLERINTGSLAEHRRDLERQIDCNRRSNIDGNQGIMIYSAKFLPKVSHTLSGELFAYPSLTPAIKSAEETTEPPRNLKLRHGSLSWHPINGVRRYTVYAVPDEVSILEAMDENGDGIDGAFLIGVTYEPRYEVGTERDTAMPYAHTPDSQPRAHLPGSIETPGDPPDTMESTLRSVSCTT